MCNIPEEGKHFEGHNLHKNFEEHILHKYSALLDTDVDVLPLVLLCLGFHECSVQDGSRLIRNHHFVEAEIRWARNHLEIGYSQNHLHALHFLGVFLAVQSNLKFFKKLRNSYQHELDANRRLFLAFLTTPKSILSKKVLIKKRILL